MYDRDKKNEDIGGMKVKKDKKLLPAGKKATWVLIGMLLICMIGIAVIYISYPSAEIVKYQLGEVIFKHSEEENEYIATGGNQIIRLTQDGVTAYDLKGNEVWNNALTIDKPIVKHKGTYFALMNKNDQKLAIFNDKGKKGEITTSNPIIYFSINGNGDVALIEKTKDGHITAAYNSKGERLGDAVEGVTYIKDAGFPVSAEVTPDKQLLLVNYIDIYNPVITSVLNGLIINKTGEEKVFNVKYGIEEKDNIIYEIEFLNNSTWAAIGDHRITFYNLQGEKIKEISNLYLKYTPYIDGELKGAGYLPILSTKKGASKGSGDCLTLFNEVGEVVYEEEFEETVTYFNATDKGVIIGQDNKFTGYTKKGEVKFTFEATQDVDKVLYVGNKLIAVTKDEVRLLSGMSEGGSIK